MKSNLSTTIDRTQTTAAKTSRITSGQSLHSKQQEHQELLCWLLRDLQWRCVEDLLWQFQGNINPEETGCPICSKDSSTHCHHQAHDIGERMLFETALLSLVHAGCCETKRNGRRRFVRLRRLTTELYASRKRMLRFHAMTREVVLEALRAVDRPSAPDLYGPLNDLDYSFLGLWARNYLICEAVAWYEDAEYEHDSPEIVIASFDRMGLAKSDLEGPPAKTISNKPKDAAPASKKNNQPCGSASPVLPTWPIRSFWNPNRADSNR